MDHNPAQARLAALFVADLNTYSKGAARLKAMSDLGVDVTPVSHTQLGGEEQGCPDYSVAYRIARRLGLHLDTEHANRKILDIIENNEIDFVWIEKGNMIRPRTIHKIKRKFPSIPVFSYSDDDMFLAHNRSRAYVRGLRHYDCVFTTKAANRDAGELSALGAARVVLVDKAFDPHQHFPVDVTPEQREALGAAVGFIGTYERERGESLLFLARNGVRVRVWGNGWRGFPEGHENLVIEGRPVINIGADLRYTKAVCATAINLGFLRRLNRDRHTDRSVEIPACGGFLLAERSDDHLRLFDEGREAAFFSSHEELLEKVRHFLDHEDERAAIAAAGRRRCVESDYSHHNRLRFMLADVLGRRR